MASPELPALVSSIATRVFVFVFCVSCSFFFFPLFFFFLSFFLSLTVYLLLCLNSSWKLNSDNPHEVASRRISLSEFFYIHLEGWGGGGVGVGWGWGRGGVGVRWVLSIVITCTDDAGEELVFWQEAAVVASAVAVRFLLLLLLLLPSASFLP